MRSIPLVQRATSVPLAGARGPYILSQRAAEYLATGVEKIGNPGRHLTHVIEGIASTPTVSSNGQSLSSKGCNIRLPIPLLFGHGYVYDAEERRVAASKDLQKLAIGTVFYVQKSETGIVVRAHVDVSTEAGRKAWELIQSGEARAFSVAPSNAQLRGVVDRHRFFESWDLREVSVCRKGANPDCHFVVVADEDGRNPAHTRTKRMHAPLTSVQKFQSAGKRTITGLASTEQLDRQGDIVVAAGGVWTTPLPLLFAHDHKQVIGVVRDVRATRDGVRVTAELVEGVAKADEVWALIEAGALDSFSIGFLPLDGEPIATGMRWTRWEMTECSVVAVPANPGAKIGKSG